ELVDIAAAERRLGLLGRTEHAAEWIVHRRAHVRRFSVDDAHYVPGRRQDAGRPRELLRQDHALADSPFSPETGGRRAFGFRLFWLGTGRMGVVGPMSHCGLDQATATLRKSSSPVRR